MILVTGGTGFIGRHLIESLNARGERVRALVRRPVSFGIASVESVRGDLHSGEGLAQALDGADAVIHLAGVTKALSRADYYAGNVTATGNLARAIAATGREIRVVHVSSLAAIGPASAGNPVGEDAEPHPLTHYGKSKLEGEKVLRSILPNAVVVRPPVVYGPRDTDVFQLLQAVNRGLVVQIAGGERWFSAVYVKDLVDGLVCALHSTVTGRAYFIAHPQPASWTELGAVAARIMGRNPRAVDVPEAAARAVGLLAEMWSQLTRKPGIVSREKVAEAVCPYWTCDTRRAREEIGFEAPTGLAQGLEYTLSWCREAGWLKY